METKNKKHICNMGTKNIKSKVVFGTRLWTKAKTLSMPYKKFSLLGFTQWGDANDIKVNEWRFLGYKI